MAKAIPLVVMLAVAAQGCFGSHLRRAGDYQRARSVAIEQGIGLAMVAGALWAVADPHAYEADPDAYEGVARLLLAVPIVAWGSSMMFESEAKDYAWARLLEPDQAGILEDMERRRRIGKRLVIGGLLLVVAAAVLQNEMPYSAEVLGFPGLVMEMSGFLLWDQHGYYVRGLPCRTRAAVVPGGFALVHMF